MVLCSDQGVLKRSNDGALSKLFDVPFRPGEKFNDITTDPAGRIFAGTVKGDLNDGILYRLEKGKPVTPVLGGLGISNGMTFSLDETTFFHTDSKTMAITRYDYDRTTGAISAPSVFFQSDEQLGLPDGITLDTHNNVWAAFWGGSCIRQISPAGKILQEVALPAKQVSSVMFGGPDLRDIYITTACEDGVDLEKGLDANGVFLGGPTYRYHSNAQGRPEWPADF
jgi:D-xylonolactonase